MRFLSSVWRHGPVRSQAQRMRIIYKLNKLPGDFTFHFQHHFWGNVIYKLRKIH